MSVRIRQVTVGSYQVGDELGGYVITSFGRSWKLDEEESCAYGAAPWERVEVCYAYGEKKGAAPVQVIAPNRLSDKAAEAMDRRAEARREAQVEAAQSPREKLEAEITAAESALTFALKMDQSKLFTRLDTEKKQAKVTEMRAALEAAL
jgi:hypothetical protein